MLNSVWCVVRVSVVCLGSELSCIRMYICMDKMHIVWCTSVHIVYEKQKYTCIRVMRIRNRNKNTLTRTHIEMHRWRWWWWWCYASLAQCERFSLPPSSSLSSSAAAAATTCAKNDVCQERWLGAAEQTIERAILLAYTIGWKAYGREKKKSAANSFKATYHTSSHCRSCKEHATPITWYCVT